MKTTIRDLKGGFSPVDRPVLLDEVHWQLDWQELCVGRTLLSDALELEFQNGPLDPKPT